MWEKKNKKNKTQTKSAFDEPLVDLTWPREKSVSLKTEENEKHSVEDLWCNTKKVYHLYN